MLFMAAKKFNNNEKKTNLEKKTKFEEKNKFERKKIVYCDVYHRNHLIYVQMYTSKIAYASKSFALI